MGCRCSKDRNSHPAVKDVTLAQQHQQQSYSPDAVSPFDDKIKRTDIREDYRLGPILGSGSFGQVRVCMKRSSEQQYACKIMTKNPNRSRRGSSHPVNLVVMFRNEIEILHILNHPNIVKLIDAYEDRHHLYAVMEKCDGGELFTRIVQKRKLSEPETVKLCREMLSAIAYIHALGIVHRDVKAENFLFTNSNISASRLVLIDFGMSIKLKDPTKHLRQVCGSPHYVAPELIKCSYKQEVDLWALGVVVFLMIYGKYPFEGIDQKQIAQRILKSEPDYTASSVGTGCGATGPTPLAISFMKGLLEKDPQKRLTSGQALKHPWLASVRSLPLYNIIKANGGSPDIWRNGKTSSKSAPPPPTDLRPLDRYCELAKAAPSPTNRIAKITDIGGSFGLGKIENDSSSSQIQLMDLTDPGDSLVFEQEMCCFIADMNHMDSDDAEDACTVRQYKSPHHSPTSTTRGRGRRRGLLMNPQ